MDPLVLLFLAAAGLFAGFVDAVAGGGGLVALPVLLSVGIPPVSALATNKFQGATGTAMAAFTYWHGGYVELRKLLFAIVGTFAGAYLGAMLVRQIDTGVLQVLVPVALIAIAIYFMFAPQLDNDSRAARLSMPLFAPVAGFLIGFYDGVFGPGTGSFFTIVFISLFGMGVVRASAHTKMLNLTSNLAALVLFIPAGNVVWPAAIAMGLGQLAGGFLGAKTGIRFGAKFIKPLVVLVSVAMAARLLLAR
ncbi:MAG TPA: hypothetical protein ENJ68_02950 [Devosia sp.]|nr:hypothetical protein [Devosia sp.]